VKKLWSVAAVIVFFNDRLYFWLLKPVARGYGFIIPEELRQAIRNAYVQNRNKLIAE